MVGYDLNAGAIRTAIEVLPLEVARGQIALDGAVGIRVIGHARPQQILIGLEHTKMEPGRLEMPGRTGREQTGPSSDDYYCTR